jgi:hypothetical protein
VKHFKSQSFGEFLGHYAPSAAGFAGDGDNGDSFDLFSCMFVQDLPPVYLFFGDLRYRFHRSSLHYNPSLSAACKTVGKIAHELSMVTIYSFKIKMKLIAQ